MNWQHMSNRVSFIPLDLLFLSFDPEDVERNAEQDCQNSGWRFQRPIHIIEYHQDQAAKKKEQGDDRKTPNFNRGFFTDFLFTGDKQAGHGQPGEDSQGET